MKTLKQPYLFGLVDGLNGAVGLVIGLLGSHADSQIILVALLSRAGSSAVSMGGAEYETEDAHQTDRWGRVAAMMAGYLSSALLPALGFAVNVRVGLIVFVPCVVIVLALTAWFRAGTVGWLRSIVTTLIVFVLAVAVGFIAGRFG